MGVLGAITAVSGIVSAGSSIAGGIAEKNAAERNAQIYDPVMTDGDTNSNNKMTTTGTATYFRYFLFAPKSIAC